MPGGTPESAFGEVSEFSTLGSNLLSTAIVVMPLSVKTRWNNVAGVRAMYSPAETRTTVAPPPFTSQAKPARGCHCFRSLGMYAVDGMAGFGLVGWGFHWPSHRRPAVTVTFVPSDILSCTYAAISVCFPLKNGSSGLNVSTVWRYRLIFKAL